MQKRNRSASKNIDIEATKFLARYGQDRWGKPKSHPDRMEVVNQRQFEGSVALFSDLSIKDKSCFNLMPAD